MRSAQADGPPGPAGNAELAGKYMTFQVADEHFGLPVLSVRELICFSPVTPVPRFPACMCGVINLRGRIIPVVDVRLKFGMQATHATEQAVIIVVQVNMSGRPITMGLLVERALEVLNVRQDAVEPPPDLGPESLHSSFITGVAKTAERVVFLLDLAAVLAQPTA